MAAFSCAPAPGKPWVDPLVAHIDSTVRPGDDFFLYANGKWFKQNPIPASESANGLWQIIQDTINAQIRSVCESSAALKDVAPGSDKQKIGDFFNTGADSVSLNAQGLGALAPVLASIGEIKDLHGLARSVAYVQMVAGAPMFSFYVTQDDRISSKNAIFIWQGGLSLPDRSFYFAEDVRAVGIRQKFLEHLANTFRIIGYSESVAKETAQRLMKLETAVARTSRKREDTRDPLKNYNKIAYRNLQHSTPELDWSEFMKGVGLQNVDTVIVGQPEFLSALNGYLKSFPLEDWKNYLKYQLVRGLGGYIDDRTYIELFNFYSTTLRGVQEPKPRWKRVVEQTDRSLGELVGKVYADEYLPKGTKEKLLEIGNAIREDYAERIRNLDWMSGGTKARALEKLKGMIIKVGYPDKWKDLSSLHVDRSSYVHNVINANTWQFNYMTAKFGKPVDRQEWVMEPQTYNAYYNPSNNEIVVPGCNVIVPGYEGKLADDAVLYGIIGGTFGHEMTHGFDDQGCKYNAMGNLDNWWLPEDSVRFFAKTRLIVQQFDGYVAVDTLHINGDLTQGENIADLGGVMMAYEAFKKTPQNRNHEIIAGLTPDQRFFLGYALGWMVNRRPEGIASQIRSNEHAPEKFRVNGPLSNLTAFYDAFGVKEGDGMWREESSRIHIW